MFFLITVIILLTIWCSLEFITEGKIAGISVVVLSLVIIIGVLVLHHYETISYETIQIEIEVAEKEQRYNKYDSDLYIKSTDGDVYLVENFENYMKMEEGNIYIIIIECIEGFTPKIINID